MNDRSIEATNEAIERATKAADAAWKAAAYDAVRAAALKHAEFITDEVHDLIPPHVSTSNLSALGGVMRKAAKNGVIVKTGRLRPSSIPHKHMIQRPIWRAGPNA